MATTGPVIIVGGGPVGRAAALELARFNLRNAALHPITSRQAVSGRVKSKT